MDKNFCNVKDVETALGVGQAKAYKIIRQLNNELKEMGFITVAGKISKKYFEERCYGYELK